MKAIFAFRPCGTKESVFGDVHGLEKLLFQCECEINLQCVVQDRRNESMNIFFCHDNFTRVNELPDKLPNAIG